jgi:hypothetical protein
MDRNTYRSSRVDKSITKNEQLFTFLLNELQNLIDIYVNKFEYEKQRLAGNATGSDKVLHKLALQKDFVINVLSPNIDYFKNQLNNLDTKQPLDPNFKYKMNEAQFLLRKVYENVINVIDSDSFYKYIVEIQEKLKQNSNFNKKGGAFKKSRYRKYKSKKSKKSKKSN